MAKSERGSGLWLMAAVAVLLGLRGLTAEPKAGGATAAASASPPARPPEGPPPAPAADAGSAEAPGAPCQARLDQVLAEFGALYPTKPRPLIALVPDPLDTGLAYYFDAVLEGIEAAVGDGLAENGQHRTWVRDRFFLPWRDLDAGDTPPEELARCRATHPGLVLYREQGSPSQSLAVLLVGESQTSGIRRAALAQAIKVALELGPIRLAGNSGEPPSLRLDLLGPTFSGTAPSLAAVLGDPAFTHPSPEQGPVTFRVRSGTASGPNVASAFKDVRTVSYESSAASDAVLSETLYCRMKTFLRVPVATSLGRPVLRGVALFSEGGTAYGAGFSAARRHPECPGPEFSYVFPNVVDVRTAWSDAPAGDAAPSGPRYTLGLGQAHDPVARVHPVLSAFTPIARDVSLTTALNDLSGKAVRYVGIVATDVNDLVFLASRVRKQLPDVRLFTFGSDVVLEHPDQAATLSGMLVAHGVLPPDVTTSRLDVSTREMVQGVYLATQSLLPLNADPEKLEPQVSVVSRSRLWGVEPGHDRTIGTVGTALPDLVPKTFVLFAALAALFALLNAGAYFAQTYVARAREFWSPLPLRALRPCRSQDFAAGHAVRSLQLLSCVSFPLLLVATLLARSGHSQVVFIEYCLVLAVTACVIAAWVDALWRMLAATVRRGAAPSDRLNALATLCLTLFLEIGALYWADGAPLARTVSLGSGVSPLLPVLFGAGILYVTALVGLIRIRLLDAQSPPRAGDPRLSIARALGAGGDSALAGDIPAIEGRLANSLRHPWGTSWLPLLLASAALGLAVVAAFTTKPLLTLERSLWHCLLVGVVFGCMLAQSSTYARMFLYFVELRMLLRRIAVHPIAGALHHLTPTLARTVEVQLLTSRPEAHALAESVRLLGALAADRADLGDGANLLGPLPAASELDALLARAKVALTFELGRVAERRVPGDAAGELREALVSIGEKLSVALAPLWGRSARLAGEEGARAASVSALVALGEAAPPLVRFLENAEGLVASLVALCIERQVRHFRYFAGALVVTAVLFVPLTALYAFQPQRLLLTLGLVATTVVVGSVLGMYFALDKDPVLSAIASTTPGEVTWNGALVTRVIAWGVVPMASVVAAQYPEFTQWLLSTVGPIAGAFK